MPSPLTATSTGSRHSTVEFRCTAGGVRPFVEEDIPHVARLHQSVFQVRGLVDPASYRDYFTRVFLDNPAGEGPLPSLVYQEEDGRIVGFLGLVPRHFTLGGRRFQGLVSSQFIVDPGCRAGLVALRLAKTYLDGPQDVAIADEANDVSRTIWEGLGGTTALLYSIYWTRPLRPSRLALSYLRQRRGLAGLAAVASPVAAIADTLATRLPGSQLRQSKPSVSGKALRGHAVLAQAAAFCGPTSLRVEYDDRAFDWLLNCAANRGGNGRLLSAAVVSGHKLLGWYVCSLADDGVADVAQLSATPASIDEVLDHLFHAAWEQGAAAVTGRMDPRFMQALSDKYCLFHRRGPWVLVKARRLEILHAFESGNAFFSRFDGEWSLRFPVPRRDEPPHSTRKYL